MVVIVEVHFNMKAVVTLLWASCQTELSVLWMAYPGTANRRTSLL